MRERAWKYSGCFAAALCVFLLVGCGSGGAGVERKGIISMAPHITEAVFALGQGAQRATTDAGLRSAGAKGASPVRFYAVCARPRNTPEYRLAQDGRASSPAWTGGYGYLQR